jgi:hypothetical protein
MTEISESAFMELAAGRTGHFVMESGLHSALWLDLRSALSSGSPSPRQPLMARVSTERATVSHGRSQIAHRVRVSHSLTMS